MTPPPDHPLLTKVLADSLPSGDTRRHGVGPSLVQAMVDAIPPDIADRLEAALDPGCRYTLSREAFDPMPDEDVLCGLGPDGASHHHLAECGDGSHAPYPGCHPYVPLVEVPHDCCRVCGRDIGWPGHNLGGDTYGGHRFQPATASEED